MALIKVREASKFSEAEREAKIKELRFELIKAAVTSNKTNAKTKEIKRTIARLISFGKSVKEALKTK